MTIKKIINTLFPKRTISRIFIGILRHSPFAFFSALFRSLLATKQLTGSFFPVACIVYPGSSLYVQRHRTAKIIMRGRLIVRPFLVGEGRSRILLSSMSIFQLDDDFEIGQNAALHAASNAKLYLGGRDTSSGSGITADTIVMAEQSLSIGKDVIIAWGCTITDSNWHEIEGVERACPTVIGDNVWISHRVSIIKGACVPKGCIVGAGSVVGPGQFPENSLIAGMPAIVRRENISWKR